MLILGIESATDRVGCAVGDHTGVRSVAQTTRGRHHAELLAPQIKAVCLQSDMTLRDIGAVAVDIGPGLYTGLRVGITTAITIAHTLDVPMIAVTSLDLLAYGVRHAQSPVAAVIDARRGEVFWACYRSGTDTDVQPVSKPAVALPEHLASELAEPTRFGPAERHETPAERHEALVEGDGGGLLMTGDGAVKYAPLFRGVSGVRVADKGFAHPSAESLVLLAHIRASRQQLVSHNEITPLYLRRPDAKAKWVS